MEQLKGAWARGESEVTTGYQVAYGKWDPFPCSHVARRIEEKKQPEGAASATMYCIYVYMYICVTVYCDDGLAD